jgi:hypothetical protein
MSSAILTYHSFPLTSTSTPKRIPTMDADM